MDEYSKLILPQTGTEKRKIIDQLDAQLAGKEFDDFRQEQKNKRIEQEMLLQSVLALLRSYLNGFKRKDPKILVEIQKALQALHDRPDYGESELRTWFKQLISRV